MILLAGNIYEYKKQYLKDVIYSYIKDNLYNETEETFSNILDKFIFKIKTKLKIKEINSIINKKDYKI